MSDSQPAKKRKIPPALTALLSGLFVSQVISTLHVYQSNHELYQRMSVILDAGFLAVPNENTLAALNTLGSAFYGGFFFSLTVGAFWSLLGFGFAWLWANMFYRRITMLLAGVVLWIIMIGCFNTSGFNPFPSAYALCVPLVVFLISVKLMAAADIGPKRNRLWLHLGVLALLVGIWALQMDKQIFTEFRDNMLLSNRIGRAVNDFYYEYTLYPAEAFKPMEKKLLKTVRLANVEAKTTQIRLEKALLVFDYLPIKKDVPVDLTVEQKGDKLWFIKRHQILFDTDMAAFLKAPGKWMRQVSRISDVNGFFRRFTFISLLLGLPVFLYAVVFCIGYGSALWILDDVKAYYAAAVICLVIGLAFLVPFHLTREGRIEQQEIEGLMASGNWRDRVAGLKRIYRDKMEIGDYPVSRDSIKSPHIAERYWLALTLAASRDPSTFRDLMKMMDDPQPNVACQVLFAIGRRGDPSMIPVILNKLNTSRHWYTQTYAYGALKDLGWKQATSK